MADFEDFWATGRGGSISEVELVDRPDVRRFVGR